MLCSCVKNRPLVWTKSYLSLLVILLLSTAGCTTSEHAPISDQRTEVIFWHFWGGKDSEVVDHIVQQFNDTNDQYVVRAVAMPGNNLQAKLFLAVAGGDPPDLVNQDDPVLADWAQRGVIAPISDVAPADQINELRSKLFPAALRLSVVDDQMWGLCNGLDIRALFYNATALQSAGFCAPRSIEQLDEIAEHFAAPGTEGLPATVGYLPDSRRLWAWGPVFGGAFYDRHLQTPTIDHPRNRAALQWMRNYQRRYGADNLASFRQGDQSLPGKTFPLLPIGEQSQVGRYVVMMDGQWRVRDIAAFENRRAEFGEQSPKFGVCPLPFPDRDNDGTPDAGARNKAGWVNGNFFVLPSGSKCPQGAWEFAKFWIGQTTPETAGQWYAQGGWIPATQEVVDSNSFKTHLQQTPLLRMFVELAQSPNQFPVPAVSGGAAFKREVEALAYDALMTPMDDEALNARIQQSQRAVERYLKTPRDSSADKQNTQKILSDQL